MRKPQSGTADLKLTLEYRLKELKASPVHPSLFPFVSALKLKRQFNYETYPNMRKQYKERLKYLIELKEIEDTIQVLTNCEDCNVDVCVRTESSVDMVTDAPPSVQDFENLAEIGGGDAEQVVADPSSNSAQGQAHILTLDDFFRRPIKVTDGTFPLNSLSTIDLHVWELYTSDPAVRAKFRNYAYVRGDLHVRIAMTGTPFHRGKVMVSYQPYPLRNENLINIRATVAAYPLGHQNLLTGYLSQSRECKVMDVRENVPIEVLCPFISPKSMHRLFNTSASVLTDVTPYEDLEEAGDIILHTMNLPQCIDPAGDGIRYYVYAWMENVELGVPTGTHVAVRTESQVDDYRTESADERKTGPVQKFASGAAGITSLLQAAPYIGPFAKASTIALSAVAGVASIFGWAKPVIIDDNPQFVKNAAFQNGANTIGCDTNFRITLDPMQELTIDNACVGSSQDELTIQYLASRQSFLVAISWDVTDLPMVPIFTSAVTPMLNVTEVINSHNIFQPSAMSFAVQPFAYWRGDIEFTFEIVCSQYHRGKLMIIYEPNSDQQVLIESTLDLNKQFVKVIDIQETQTFTVSIGWANFRSWAKTWRHLTSAPFTGTALPLALGGSSYNNGFITVVPFTQLTSPDGSNIEINVYAKSPNMMVNKLEDNYLAGRRNDFVAESMIDENHISTTESAYFVLNESTAGTDTICLEHFGERPISFRSLLKRYVTIEKISSTLDAYTLGVVRVIAPIYPAISLPYGTDSGPTRDLYSYLRYAYLGVRGGMRKRVKIGCSATQDEHAFARVSLNDQTTSQGAVSVSHGDNYANMDWAKASGRGTVTMDQSSNGGIEVELPFYSANLFAFSFADDLVGSNPGGIDNMDTDWTRAFQVNTNYINTLTSDRYICTMANATAEDFQLMRFCGAPYHTYL